VEFVIIKQLSLDSFGKFKNQKVDFVDGINLVYGKNENGKSTMKNFVEIILAGLSDVRLMEQYSKEIKKYKPWHTKDEYFGSIICEDDEAFVISKDFNDPKDIKIFYQNTMEEVAENATIDKVRSLGLIGVSEMKGAKGRELIAEVINRISNIKKSNVNGLCYDEIMDTITIRIEDLESNEEYKTAKSEIDTVNDQIKQLQNHSATVKKLMREQKGLDLQIDKLTSETSILQKKLYSKTIEEYKTKYERIKKINEELSHNSEQVNQLESIANLDGKDVQDYLDKKKELEKKNDTLVMSKEDLESLKNEVNKTSSEFNEGTYEALKDEAIREKLKKYFRNFRAAEKDLDYINKKIERYEEMAEIKREEEVKSAKKEFTDSELKRLEKDYYKFVNTQGWVSHIESNDDLIELAEKAKGKIKRHQDKAKKFMPRIIGSAVAIIISLLLFIVIGFNFIELAVGVGGIVLIGLSLFQRNLELQPIGELEASLQTYNDKIAKNNELHDKYALDLEEILKKYACKTSEEFLALYKSAVPVADKSVSIIEEKMKVLKEDLEKLHIKLRVLIDKINQVALTSYDVNDFDFEEHMKELESCMLIISYDHSGREEKIKSLTEKISKLEFEIKLAERELEKHPIVVNNLADQIDGIEEKKSLKRQLENNIKNLEESKKEILKDKNEEELKDIYQNIINDTVGNISFDMASVNDKELNEKKDKKIELLEKCTGIKNKILTISDKMVNYKHYLILKNHYSRVIDEASYNINMCKKVKNKLEAASNKITDSYSTQIVNKMNKILYNVTGKYDDMMIGEDMTVYFREMTSGDWIEVNNLSLGTIDQAYFALRVGLTDSVLSNINLPIILDDSFIQYDQYRLANILEELAKMKRQVIILSCHMREKTILENKGITFNYIHLDTE
jgi:DNA repair exonuclease SbcCD ATPase subunit